MKRIGKHVRHIATAFHNIKLVDKCLIIFMTILMLQSTYSLFLNEVNSQETSNIDIVVRTTSAAIFGYFLSVNFLKSSERHDKHPNDNIEITDQTSLNPEKREQSTANNQQIIIATIIGITALFILILVRNFFTLTPGMLSTISQMRDFVSGCVGFLLGYPASETKSKP